ncbi:MAG: tyrosine-type recombinase/integrase [Actinomycetota bacterium]
MRAHAASEERSLLRASYLSAGGIEVASRANDVAAFFNRFGSIESWRQAPLHKQLAVNGDTRTFVNWLALTGRVRLSTDYLLVSESRVANMARRLHLHLHERLAATAADLGFTPGVFGRQWLNLARLSSLNGLHPEELTADGLESGREVLLAAAERAGRSLVYRKELQAAFFGLGSTLFHAGMIDRLLDRRWRRAGRAEVRWDELENDAPMLTATMRRYLGQIALSLRPDSVRHADTSLRLFARFLVDDYGLARVADVKRPHIEAYKKSLALRPGSKGPTLGRPTIRGHLGVLRVFFDRVIEWDYEDAPVRTPIFAGDLPVKEEPLPRFLDDGAAAKLLRTARADPDPFVRLSVEMLARTGMRKGELVRLTVDAVVQIGSSYWLRIPLGKLHNDRYIPLHPQLKELLDEWLKRRPATLRSPLMFTDKGQPISHARVDAAIRKVAAAAGIGHITPHQLRHTLATQAINRGMSLEAIAALLGHKSLAMTMVYARIADRTVANEYFAVSEKVEALYDQPKELPADAEGTEMAKLRREMHRRMLGNGYCARPVGLDCHFESICESCTFFVTTIEFRPTLQRQRDDAAAKGQVGRQKIFEGLLSRLDKEAS